jgi:hypothetical protein
MPQQPKLIKKNPTRLRGDTETELQLQQYEIRRLQQRVDAVEKANVGLKKMLDNVLKDVDVLKRVANRLHRTSKRALSSNTIETPIQQKKKTIPPAE